MHRRATIKDLSAAGRTVYAIDLLGFGSSEKPQVEYAIELWSRQLLEFIDTVVVQQDGATSAVLVGNSIGSLSCLVEAMPFPFFTCIHALFLAWLLQARLSARHSSSWQVGFVSVGYLA